MVPSSAAMRVMIDVCTDRNAVLATRAEVLEMRGKLLPWIELV